MLNTNHNKSDTFNRYLKEQADNSEQWLYLNNPITCADCRMYLEARKSITSNVWEM